MKTIKEVIVLLLVLLTAPLLYAEETVLPCHPGVFDPMLQSKGMICGTDAELNGYEKYKYTDNEGIQRVGQRRKHYFVECRDGFCVESGGDNEIAAEIPQQGMFKIRSGYYLDLDVDGNPTTYAWNTGPRFDGAVADTETSSGDVEACVDAKIAETRKIIGEEAPIDYMTIQEWESECK